MEDNQVNLVCNKRWVSWEDGMALMLGKITIATYRYSKRQKVFFVTPQFLGVKLKEVTRTTEKAATKACETLLTKYIEMVQRVLPEEIVNIKENK